MNGRPLAKEFLPRYYLIGVPGKVFFVRGALRLRKEGFAPAKGGGLALAKGRLCVCEGDALRLRRGKLFNH